MTGQNARERPAYKLLRYEEDWSRLRGRDLRTNWTDTLKYLRLLRQEGWYLTLGGDVRQLFEYFDHPSWGRDAPDSKSLLQRYMLHSDIHLGPRVRLFGQIKSGLESGRKGGPRPADEDRLDLHQAFVEARLLQSGRTGLTVRAGRQEIELGSSRLVSAREGPNVRQSFDGARVTLTGGDWQLDGFASRPAGTSRGVFDDSPDHNRSFWGVYGVRPFPTLPGGHIDLYYLGLDRKRTRFDAGAGRELRHSVGARMWGKTTSWDYNYETVFQWGRFASGSIRAWTIASDTGFRIDTLRLRPRLGLRADVASGDHDLSDQKLETFNALFPRGAYFSEADLLGPYNLMDVHPSVELNLSSNLKLTTDVDLFWRQSVHDGIYGIAGNLLARSNGIVARYIGFHARAQVAWNVNRHATVAITYLHFFPGEFLRQAPPNRAVNFVSPRFSYSF